MIPKIIHYCWFGNTPKSKLVKKCIKSWHSILPDYKIKEWNENNFDVDMFAYTREAYAERKFAFVSDVARLFALYTEGGIYLDTDVEVLQSFNSFLHNCAFVGYEKSEYIATAVMAAERQSLWIKNNFDHYANIHFINANGECDLTTNVKRITDELISHGLCLNNSYQEILGYVTIYPSDYFSPCDWRSLQIKLTSNTVCIHHFLGTWHSIEDQKKSNEIRFRRTYPFWGILIYSPKIIYRKIKKFLYKFQ